MSFWRESNHMLKKVMETDDEELILGKIDTEDLLLLNVLYHRPTKERGWNDYASVLLKNVSTGEKQVVLIQNPRMVLYEVKEECRDYNYTPAYREKKDTIPHKIAYKDVIKEIEKIAGEQGREFIQRCNNSKNYSAKKNIHKYPYVLATDYDYPSLFRINWLMYYANPDIKVELTKMYLDIEVDSIDVPGFPTPDICPINAVSIVDPTGSTVYEFMLDNPDNKQIGEFMDNIESFKQECKDKFNSVYGDFEYKFILFQEEIDMLRELFKLINRLKRDFCLIWNMGFDIPYIINRIKVLGYDPSEIMCPDDVAIKECYYKKDMMHFDFKTRNDAFFFNSYTVFLDQMAQYIKIRKSRSEIKSVKLNNIAKIEIGDEKLDYSEDANIKTLPYVDYHKFILYNIKDSLLLLGIENRTNDIDNVFHRASQFATPYNLIFSQTRLLKNHAYDSYMQQGFVIGNNRNVDYSNYSDPDDEKNLKEKFEGALVGDPLLNSRIGAVIFNQKSKFVFLKCVDFDFSSMYPYVKIAHNIGHETMIGKIQFDSKYNIQDVFPNATEEDDGLRDNGKDFAEAILSRDYAYIGSRFLSLPSVEEIESKLMSKFK